MPFLFLLLFIAVPLAEIALLIKVGQYIGWLPTIFIVILTAVVGTALLRQQGFGVMARVAEALADGKMPVEPVIEGLCLIVAGAFLLTPGLITDATGFLLLIPVVRIALAKSVLQWMLRSGNVNVYSERTQYRGSAEEADFDEPFEDARRSGGGQIIDGEYSRVDDDEDRK